MCILVAAVPGAGKTTVLETVKKKLPNIEIANVGDLVFTAAKKKFKIKTRDELRKKLNVEQEREIHEIVASKIAKMKKKTLLIDTHLSIKTPTGYFPGVSEKFAKAVKLDMIVVLEFNPKDVLQRRKKDKKRNRDVETEKEIEAHQKYNQEVAFAVSADVEAPVQIIDLRFKEKKPFEQAYKAANQIIKLIKSQDDTK